MVTSLTPSSSASRARTPPPAPAEALAATAAYAEGGIGEYDEDEAEDGPRRSLADRIGDWIEHRIALGQARLEAEAPL